MSKKILITDDHDIFSLGLKVTLEMNPDFTVTATASDTKEMLELITNDSFDLVIADYLLPGKDGLSGLIEAKNIRPELKTILISSIEEEKLKNACKEKGINGYLYKSTAKEYILEAVTEVFKGNSSFPEFQKNPVPVKKQTGESPFKDLTGREIEVVKYMARGFNLKQTGDALGISSKTVEIHRTNLRKKMGNLSTAEIIRHAYVWGLIKDNELVSLKPKED